LKAGILTTTPLLKHLVALTGHRDHQLLDRSIVSALHELAGASQARVLEITLLQNELRLLPRAWIEHGKLMLDDHQDSRDSVGEAITQYPALCDCLARHLQSIDDVSADQQYTLWLPIWHNESASGCLQICRTKPFTPALRQMIEGVLSVYRNFQNLLDYSERDSLTGLLNRKTFDENFSKMVSASPACAPHASEDSSPERRQLAAAQSQWLAVVDIDHFKRVNDQFGHLYGDEVLILVANLLRSSFRVQDRVFRFGGEEFVVLLRSSTLDDARKAFERFRANIEAHDFPQLGTVTVSLGFVSITTETPVVILGHADQALYHAKTHGRKAVSPATMSNYFSITSPTIEAAHQVRAARLRIRRGSIDPTCQLVIFQRHVCQRIRPRLRDRAVDCGPIRAVEQTEK
jgi:diguanylate cyclase (GGDEF)-like protein